MPLQDGILLEPSNVKISFVWNKATDVPSAVLTIKNDAMFTIVVNVKTTNPARYIVTPPNSIVKSCTTTDILFEFSEKDAVACWNQRIGSQKADRFMIQAAKVFSMDSGNLPEGEGPEFAKALSEWWARKAEAEKQMSKRHKSIHAQKLESVFIFPGEPGSEQWGKTNIELNKLQSKYEDLERRFSELKLEKESIEADRDVTKGELESTRTQLISALTTQTGLQMALQKTQRETARLKDTIANGFTPPDSNEDEVDEKDARGFSALCACFSGDASAAGLDKYDDAYNLPKPVEINVTFRQRALGIKYRFDEILAQIVVSDVQGQAKASGVKVGDTVVKLNGRSLVHPGEEETQVTDKELKKLVDALPRPVKLSFIRSRATAMPYTPPAPSPMPVRR